MTNILYDTLLAPHSKNDATFLLLDEPGAPAKLSYAAFVAQTAQLAHVLVENGVSPGDRVLVQAPCRCQT